MDMAVRFVLYTKCYFCSLRESSVEAHFQQFQAVPLLLAKGERSYSLIARMDLEALAAINCGQ